MSKNVRSDVRMQSEDRISRKKTSMHTDSTYIEDRSLKPTKSYQRILNLNTGVLNKVRSRQFDSVGGEVLGNGDDTFYDLANLLYDAKGGIIDKNERAAGARIKHTVKARKEFKRHIKEEVGLVGFHDPIQKKALRKLKIRNFPKNDAVRTFLKNAILKNISFSKLTQTQIELMVNALKPKKIAEDVSLLVEGDIGKSFYIVQKGVLVASEKDKVLCKFSKGDSFGELALLYGTKRQMSVKTEELCFLWKLDSMSFKKILAHGEDERADYELIFEQLKLMPLVVESGISANEEQLTFLAQNIHPIRVNKGQVLIRKGDPGGDMMYFIKQGRVRCTRAENNSEAVEFISGDYFGEGSLLHRFMLEKQSAKLKTQKEKQRFLTKYKKQWKRAANVVVSRDTEFFIIDYDAFKRLAELDNKFLETMNHNYGLRILKTSKFINSLRRTYREFLLENLEILEYNNKDVIIQEGEYEKVVFLVVQGKVVIQNESMRKKGKRYGITVGGAFGLRQFFDPTKPYEYNLVASGKVKIFAMTYSIFSALFGADLKMEDVLKTGDPAIDEKTTVDSAIWEMDAFNMSSFAAVNETLSSKSPRSSSKILQKISTNFEVDQHTSIVKRKKQSVKVKKQAEEEQIGLTIENHMQKMARNHSAKLKSFKQMAKYKAPTGKAEDIQVLHKKFKIMGPIGMGTFGMVKIVKQKAKGKQRFALKILDIRKVIKLGQQEAVINERDILAELKHPFVLKYLASYKDKKELCILTELLVGGELFEIIQNYRNDKTYMPDEHTIFYTACMVETFSYLHKHNILYRDIKPENIMIDGMGYTRLVDFGFAKKCKFKTFTRCGTAEYFAPELLTQRGYNKSVDLWGIGILTYEMMTGMSPFYSDDHLEMLDFILNEDPDFGEDFPEDGMDFIERLLEKEPNERLGMSLKNPKELKKHPFLVGINWRKLYMKELPPPFVPDKKPRVKTEEELRQRLDNDDIGGAFQVELSDKDYKGWYDDF